MTTITSHHGKELSAEVQSLAAEILEMDAQAVRIDGNLRDLGMDSLKLLFLIDSLESLYGLRLTGKDLGPENFRSVDSICKFLGGEHEQ